MGSKIASVSEPELVILAGVSMWSLVLVSAQFLNKASCHHWTWTMVRVSAPP